VQKAVVKDDGISRFQIQGDLPREIAQRGMSGLERFGALAVGFRKNRSHGLTATNPDYFRFADQPPRMFP